jgi:peptidoglycan hydrolase-like protein with peptidoglycan-binding domain
MAHVFNQSTRTLSTFIRAEVEFDGAVSDGSRGVPVRRVQEWLNLHGQGVVVDGIFGPATGRAVSVFQSANGLSATGTVDENTFDKLVAPMLGVLKQRVNRSVPLAEAIVEHARAHLEPHPREVGGPNSGPWVRLYMGGREGEAFAWCAGFVTFLLDQAAQSLEVGKPITGSVSCDTLAAQASSAGVLLSGADAAGKLTPGSIFLVRRVSGDWTHTGVVTAVHNDTFDTIEGNTNDAGQREGYEVCARTRSYADKDFVLI